MFAGNHSTSTAAVSVPATSGGGTTTPVFKWSTSLISNDGSPLTLSRTGGGAWPSGTASFPLSTGDLLLAVAVDCANAGSLSLSGFTNFIDAAHTTTRIDAWWKIATGSEPTTYATTGWSTSAVSHEACLMCFQAGTFNVAAPIYGLAGPSDEHYGVTSVLPSVTINAAADLYCGLIIGDASDNGGSTSFPPAGWTQTMNLPATVGSYSGNHGLGWGIVKSFGATGATGTTTVTTSDTAFGIEKRTFGFGIAAA